MMSLPSPAGGSPSPFGGVPAREHAPPSGDGEAVLGWGVVGCGWVARDHGGPGIQAAPNARLAAAFDRDPAALDRFCAAFPHARRCGSLEELLDDPAVGAVYVATPNHAHREPAEACAAAGVPTLLEKPLAHTVEDAAAIVTAFERTGTPLAVAFDQRHHPAHQKLAELVAAGALGTVTHARIHYACWLPADWSPDQEAHDNWRRDAARAGGGAAIDLAPHGLDLLATVLDSRWESLHALVHTAVQNYSVDDGAVLTGRLTGGPHCGDALASLHVGYDTPDALPRRRLELVGTRASVVLENTMGQTPGGRFTRFDAATGAATDVPFDTAADPFARQAEAFSRCVFDGTPFPHAVRDDLRRHELLLAALHHANADGRAA